MITKFEQYILEKKDEIKVMSIEKIAKKHNYDLEGLKQLLKIATKIEREHSDNKDIAEKVALKNIEENPLYYHNKYGLPEIKKRLDKIKREEREEKEKLEG